MITDEGKKLLKELYQEKLNTHEMYRKYQSGYGMGLVKIELDTILEVSRILGLTSEDLE